MSKRFHVGTILTVTTHRILPPLGFDGIFLLLNYLTRDNLHNHQLPRAADECVPWLLRWHPDLAKADLAELDRLKEHAGEGDSKGVAQAWLDAQRIKHGWPEYIDLDPIPQDDHERKHFWDELVALRGTDEGLIAVSPNVR